MFIDTARIYVNAGKGGNGVNSFYRDKLTRSGHPDGGDGGFGGNVVIRVSTNVHTLIDFRYRQHFKAKDGKHGSSKQKKGADGEDCVILAPPGTIVYDAATGELIADLITPGEELLIAKGGNNGKGNRSHKDATDGEFGEEKLLRLELKFIADVGIIGVPNAGKSTLIVSISNARPKIAAYPFTTKNAVLGVVRQDDFEFKVVEVPGLITGAHQGKGLGDLFLRHVERTRILVHLVDVSQELSEVLKNYEIINKEISLYGKGVEKKEKILVFNKSDLPGAEENINTIKAKINSSFLVISAKTGQGIDDFKKAISEKVKRHKAQDE